MSAVDWFFYTALALLIVAPVTAIALRFDRRTLDGDPVWAKPLKFELSLAIHFMTLAWLAAYLPGEIQTSALLVGTAIMAALATSFEMGYMVVQAARQRRSHFNIDTPVEALLYSFMAIGAVVITVAAAIVGIFLLSSETPAIGGGLKIGGGTGLVLGAILTLVTAFRIGSAMSRYNGAEPSGGRRMPLTGWSLTVADRRIPHFFATHLMQVLPALGWVSDAVFRPSVSIFLVSLTAAIYTLLTFHLFRKVNRGDVIAWNLTAREFQRR